MGPGRWQMLPPAHPASASGPQRDRISTDVTLESIEAPFLSKVTVPVYLTGTAGREETLARQTADRIPHSNKTLFVQTHGVHGSSTLHASRNPKGHEANWTSAMTFLASLRKRRRR